MKNLYIIGARGCGREVYGLFLVCENLHKDIRCAGFLDDKSEALDGFEGYPPVVSSVEDFIPKADDVFICALGAPKWVKHYTEIIERKGGKFISLISPSAYIGKNVKIGAGCVICGWSVISCDVSIGSHSYIGVFSDIGHDVIIGSHCHLGAYTFVGGRSEIGNTVTGHPRVSILPDRRIFDNAIIGAGSIVIRNVKEGQTVFGIPAKKI